MPISLIDPERHPRKEKRPWKKKIGPATGRHNKEAAVGQIFVMTGGGVDDTFSRVPSGNQIGWPAF